MIFINVPFFDHGFQVALHRPAVDLGKEVLEFLDGQAAMLQDVADRFGLAIRESVQGADRVSFQVPAL